MSDRDKVNKAILFMEKTLVYCTHSWSNTDAAKICNSLRSIKLEEESKENKMRRVEITGHNIHFKGTFHGWTHAEHKSEIGIHTKLQAVVESEGGDVSYVEPYMMKFLDPVRV